MLISRMFCKYLFKFAVQTIYISHQILEKNTVYNFICYLNVHVYYTV